MKKWSTVSSNEWCWGDKYFKENVLRKGKWSRGGGVTTMGNAISDF